MWQGSWFYEQGRNELIEADRIRLRRTMTEFINIT